MMQDTVDGFRAMSDERLGEEVLALARRERTATTVLIAALAEFDSRRLHTAQSCPSTFVFCVHYLHLSEAEAYLRIRAAKLSLQFPIVLDLLADGSLTLTNLNLLSPYLTPENHQDLLHAATYKTRRDVERQICALDPGRAQLVTIVLKVSPETRDKLRRAQDLLQSTAQKGDAATVFDRALTIFLSDLERRKMGATAHPRRSSPVQMTSRHVPRALRRRVWARDDGRCAFVGTLGRCPETSGLQFHHVVPFAHGGPTTFENIQLRCQPHNQYEADLAGLGRAVSRPGSSVSQDGKEERAG
jgi:hypothetical protein